jgi:hypothetical protein
VQEFPVGIHVLVRGRVQGVGFRYFVKQAAMHSASPAGCAIFMTVGWRRSWSGLKPEVQTALDQLVRGPRNAQGG